MRNDLEFESKNMKEKYFCKSSKLKTYNLTCTWMNELQWGRGEIHDSTNTPPTRQHATGRRATLHTHNRAFFDQVRTSGASAWASNKRLLRVRSVTYCDYRRR